jgi:hypothetical protein
MDESCTVLDRYEKSPEGKRPLGKIILKCI